MKKSKAATIEMVKQEIARRERAYKRALKASTKAINAALNDGSDIAAMNRDALLHRDVETALKFLAEVRG